jgi:FtsZ-binding cell division protein ZapB
MTWSEVTLVAFSSGFIGTIASYFLFRKKHVAEAKGVELDNLGKDQTLTKDILAVCKAELKEVMARNEALEKKVGFLQETIELLRREYESGVSELRGTNIILTKENDDLKKRIDVLETTHAHRRKDD